MLRLDLGERPFGEWGLGAAGGNDMFGVAAGKRDRSGDGRGRYKRACIGSSQTRYSPKARAFIE